MELKAFNQTRISNARDVMDNFMKKLNNNELKCDREPFVKEDLEINNEFIDEQIESYSELLNSPLMQEEKYVKKLTPQNDRK